MFIVRKLLWCSISLWDGFCNKVQTDLHSASCTVACVDLSLRTAAPNASRSGCELHPQARITRPALNHRSDTGASLVTFPEASASPTAVFVSAAQGVGRVSARAHPAAGIASSRGFRRQLQHGAKSRGQRRQRFQSMPTAADADSTNGEDGDVNSVMAATRSQRTVAIAGLAVVATIVLVTLSRQGFSVQQTVEAIQNAVRDNPTAGPLIFIAAYAIAAVVLIPGAARAAH